MNIYKCENCNNVHDGKYGSGRFCTNKCARGFSTKNKRTEINIKVSKKQKQNLKNEQEHARKCASYSRQNEILSLYNLSTRTVSKILKRLKLSCSLCNWYVDNVVGDLHHIISKKNGGTDNHDNLTYVCPNCHRLIHSNKIDVNKIITLEDYIGNEWKKYYYVKNNKIMTIDF